MRRNFLIICTAIALFAGACAPEPAEPETTPAVESTVEMAPTEAEPMAEAQTFTVMVDGSDEETNSANLAYFPNEVAVHPGDTIDFQLVDTGEPHTVSFGSLVDAAAAVYAEMGMAAAEAPEFASLPVLLPEGSPEAVQSAAQPCYLETGEPGTDVCAEQELPAFDGSASFYSSGWLAPEETFSVTFAEDTAPGEYSFICLLHVPFMTGTVTVEPAETEIATPDEVTTAGEAQLAAQTEIIRTAVDAAAPPGPNSVLGGLLTEESISAMANVFIPAELEIAAGDTVTWLVMGPHTISFNPPQDAMTVRIEAADGSVQPNPAVMAPVNSAGMPAPPPESEPAPDAATPDPAAPPPPPVEIDGGTWNGEGFLSSGAIVSFPPALFTYKLAFDTPGTYPYVCLIHPKMEGTIVVQ